MNYGEDIQVSASAYWRINIGDYRSVAIVDASAGMVKDTAIALSETNPKKEVIVTTNCYIRWVFKAGEEVNPLSDEEVVKRCPYDSIHYRECWTKGQSFPTEAWISIKQDGQKSIL